MGKTSLTGTGAVSGWLALAAFASMTAAAQAPPEVASTTALSELKAHIAVALETQAKVGAAAFASVSLTLPDAREAASLLWNERRKALQRERRSELRNRIVELGPLRMPLYYTVTGAAPPGGRSLYLSLHGGGGAPAAVNDEQWKNQQSLYQVAEGVYVAPRAPTDTWDLWHQAHIDQFVDRLIETMVALENVDPNRVYLQGYSAGGDGVYQLAPRMADRFAAAAMMAGHPNDATPDSLRNLPFTIHVGAEDAPYERNDVAARWGRRLDELQSADPEGYPHWTKIYAGKGHWLDGEDAAALPWMARHRRAPYPSGLVWRQDDVTHTRFYWLKVNARDARPGALVEAHVDGQIISVDRSQDLDHLTFRLHDDLLDMDQDIEVRFEGRTVFSGRAARTIGAIADSLAERSDPASLCFGEITVSLKP